MDEDVVFNCFCTVLCDREKTCMPFSFEGQGPSPCPTFDPIHKLEAPMRLAGEVG